jgi:hypothetical protein
MDPFVTLARASAVTTKLKLGAGITLIPERNPRRSAAGRDPKSIEVMAYMAPTERAQLQALAEAGTDSAVLLLTNTPEAAALAELEQIAKAVL